MPIEIVHALRFMIVLPRPLQPDLNPDYGTGIFPLSDFANAFVDGDDYS